jgi:hypothetical protein
VTEIASGKELAEEIKADVRKRVGELVGGPPCLCVVLVGEDPASLVYVRGKGRAARACGIESRTGIRACTASWCSCRCRTTSIPRGSHSRSIPRRTSTGCTR